MNIGCFLSDVSTGGGNYLTKDFSKNIFKLNNYGYKITLITSTNIFNKFLDENNLKYIKLKFSFFENFILRLWKIKQLRKLLNFFKVTSPIKNFVKKNNFDLVVFNSPSSYIYYCKDINYIACLWNTEIDDLKNFVEFNKSNFSYQKSIIETAVKDSYRLFVFTEKNKDDLVCRFKCPVEKILVQNVKPFFPQIYEKTEDKTIFRKEYENFGLNKNKKWMFYPAQFWSHKNHEYIINSIEEIDKLGMTDINFIFCGRDKGYLSEIKSKISKKNLNDRFKIFDYLDDYKVISLYLFSFALIIPTYVGRTTMPLLESFFFNKKIFYSNNILDEKYYNFVSSVDLNSPKNFAEKLYEYVSKEKSKNINLKEIYKKECDDDLFLNRYKKIFDQYKLEKNIKSL